MYPGLNLNLLAAPSRSCQDRKEFASLWRSRREIDCDGCDRAWVGVFVASTVQVALECFRGGSVPTVKSAGEELSIRADADCHGADVMNEGQSQNSDEHGSKHSRKLIRHVRAMTILPK